MAAVEQNGMAWPQLVEGWITFAKMAALFFDFCATKTRILYILEALKWKLKFWWEIDHCTSFLLATTKKVANFELTFPEWTPWLPCEAYVFLLFWFQVQLSCNWRNRWCLTSFIVNIYTLWDSSVENKMVQHEIRCTIICNLKHFKFQIYYIFF